MKLSSEEEWHLSTCSLNYGGDKCNCGWAANRKSKLRKLRPRWPWTYLSYWQSKAARWREDTLWAFSKKLREERALRQSAQGQLDHALDELRLVTSRYRELERIAEKSKIDEKERQYFAKLEDLCNVAESVFGTVLHSNNLNLYEARSWLGEWRAVRAEKGSPLHANYQSL